MRFIRSIVLFVALFPGLALALGLGKIQSQSALNEPFSARIDLIDPTVEELDSLNVRLADVEAFRRAGIPRHRILMDLQFSIKQTETGPDYINIYSNEPIREPFLNFLIEVRWSNGRLYREYTVLLDPPLYTGARTRQKAPQPAAPAPAREEEVRAIEDNQVVYDPGYRPSDRPTPAPVPARPVDYSGGDYGPVVSGDTLWSIASAMRPDASVSVQQMMLALLRTNPEAFINNNINGLKRGHVLKMPDLSEVQSVTKSTAFAEAKLQNNLWEEARGALATTVTPRPETTTAEQLAAPAVEAEPAPGVAEDEAELRLVAPAEEGMAGEQEGVASNEALAQELALANESLEALKLENIELRDKLSETEAIIDDLNRLIVLKESELAELQQQIATAEMQAQAQAEAEAEAQAEAEAEAVEPAAGEEEREAVAPAEEIAEEPAAETAAADAEQDKPVEAAQPAGDSGFTSLIPPALGGIVDTVRNNLLYVAAAIIGLLLLVVGGIYAKRRREEPAAEIPQSAFPDFDEMEAETAPASEDITDINPELDAAAREETLMPESDDETISPEFGESDDATQVVAPEAKADTGRAAAPAEEEEDPLAEVNVFLAYEHFDQAEEFVKEALEKEPDNLEFHTKLLEVYYAANNRKGYEEAARVLHDKVGGEGDYWNMAVAMWKEMSPNRELFAEPVAGEEEEEAAAESETGEMLNIAGDEESARKKGLDLDFAATEDTSDIEETNTAEASEEDADILDVTAAIDIDDDEVLDVTAATDEEQSEAPESTDEDALDISAAGDDEGLDLSLDQAEPDENVESESEEDGSLDFSLDIAEEETARPADADKDALDLSFDTGTGEEAAEPAADEDSGLDMSLEAGGEEEAVSEEDEGLDFSLDMDSDTQEKSESDDSMDLEFDVDDSGEEAAEPAADEDSGLDMSLDIGDDAEKAEAAGEDDALDFSLDMDSDTQEKSESDDSMDLEFDVDDSGEEAAEPAADEDSGLDMSLDIGDDAEKAEAAGEGDALDFSLDLDDSVSQEADTGGDQGTDLLEVSSTPADDTNLEEGDDILDVSKGATAGGDLLDVTKTTSYEPDKDEDLLDVTTAATGAGMDADELLKDEKEDAGEESVSDMDIEGGLDFNFDEDEGDGAAVDVEEGGLDFELSPDDADQDDESALDFSIDGGEELDESGEGGPEESPEIDMDATMQMPGRSKLEPDSGIDEEEDRDQTIMVPRSADTAEQSEEDEIASQLDLAKAYVELGDTDNAKTILNEVIAIGNDSQRQQAEELLGQIQ